MKRRILSLLAVLLFVSTGLYTDFTKHESNNKTEIQNCYECNTVLTYVYIVEGGQLWEYIYCGDTLIDKRVVED
jgi:hypothetical protein